MSNSFHLAIPAGDLHKAEEFYIKILEEESLNGLPRKLIDESKNNFIL